MVISCSFNGGRQCWRVVGDAVGISKSLVYGFLDGFDVFFFFFVDCFRLGRVYLFSDHLSSFSL